MSEWWHNVITMAGTLRLPEPLEEESKRYAKALGLSLNGLVAVALRDYLDGRGPPKPPPPTGPLPKIWSEQAKSARERVKALKGAAVAPEAVPSDSSPPDWLPAEFGGPVEQPQQVQRPAGLASWSRLPAKGRRAPCPCGSRLQWRQCHGKD